MKPLSHHAFRLLLGTRFPTVTGSLITPGISAPVRIARDRSGIPHIFAKTDEDAWYGLGFCQGQDRTFQVEALIRASRGQLSQLLGPETLAIDRISRRVGFHRAAQAQFKVQAEPERLVVEAFVRGFNAGATVGRPSLSHEHALLRARKPITMEAADVTAILALMSFLLASNWDAELARFQVLELDGPEALGAVDRPFQGWNPIAPDPRKPKDDQRASAGDSPLARLSEEVAALRSLLGAAGGSNNWVISGKLTASGKPILANDPHLAPLLPAQWYLAHLKTPEWEVAGACLAGSPGVCSGHNGHAAWGVTAGLVDNTDLFLEEISADGLSVRQGDHWIPCPRLEEKIEIRGRSPQTEHILITPRGPIVGPALDPSPRAISLAAAWLQPRPIRGLLSLHRVRNFDEFRRAFDGWNALTLNIVYADSSGDIGWQLIGQPPIRKNGATGMLPQRGTDPKAGWEPELAPYSAMPFALNPDDGFIATANNRPRVKAGCDLGQDFLEDYRVNRIEAQLKTRKDWDVRGTQRLQVDVHSLVWEELRERLLGALATRTGEEIRLLREWDGEVGAREPGAAIFEVLLAELTVRAARAKAPRSYPWALGRGFADPLAPHTLFGFRTMAWISRLLRDSPKDWFPQGWDTEISAAFDTAVSKLRAQSGLPSGSDPGSWHWGEVRPLELQHPFGRKRIFRSIFNRGPISWGGDTSTIAQAAVPALSPLDPPVAIATYRMVVDLANLGKSRFALAGGQSGNPLSPHYDDLLPLWKQAQGVPIAWGIEEVTAATASELSLTPS